MSVKVVSPLQVIEYAYKVGSEVIPEPAPSLDGQVPLDEPLEEENQAPSSSLSRLQAVAELYQIADEGNLQKV